MAKRGPPTHRNRPPSPYGRQHALVLVNGLAEQPETWFRNHHVWRRYFDVTMPNLFAYDGPVLHQRIEAGLPISVDFLVGQLHQHLEEFVQTPPYHLVANSMGGKIVVEYAVRYPERVASIVLICPSGLSAAEVLPIVDGCVASALRESSRASSLTHGASSRPWWISTCGNCATAVGGAGF